MPWERHRGWKRYAAFKGEVNSARMRWFKDWLEGQYHARIVFLGCFASSPGRVMKLLQGVSIR
jgi:hypothetical protein